MTLEQTLRQIKRTYFWRERGVIFFLIAVIMLNLINWLWVIFSLKEKTKVIPLHSSFLFGVDRIGSKVSLFEIPAVGFFILALNFVLAFLFYERGKKLATQLLLVSSLLLQIILLLSAILIVKL